MAGPRRYLPGFMFPRERKRNPGSIPHKHTIPPKISVDHSFLQFSQVPSSGLTCACCCDSTLETMSVRKIIERVGDQRRYPEMGSRVAVSYHCWFYDPMKVDDKFRGRQVGQPMADVTIQLDKGILLPACEAEILKMSVGERALLIVPSPKAYGKAGIPALVPPNTDILIEMELLGISKSRQESIHRDVAD